MDEASVPLSTLRVLGQLLVIAFEVAREKAVDVYARVKPLVEPPDDLRMTSRLGALYSGLIVLDRGEVIAGFVVQTGQTIPNPAVIGLSSSPYPPRPLHTEQRSEKLRGWAEDVRDDEESRWRRD